MKVYVLVVGESYAGYYGIVDIYKNRQDAVNAAKNVYPDFNKWEGNDVDGWWSGCDYMEILVYEVVDDAKENNKCG